MAVTARNFVGSYFEKDRLTTVQYPEERDVLPENSRNFPFLVFDMDDADAGSALRRLQDLRKGMSAAVHLHRQEHGQEARLHGQAAVLSGDFRHRHLGLHELPDLRRGLSLRSDQDGQGLRAEPARALRRAPHAQRATSRSRTITITAFIRAKRRAVDAALAAAAAAKKKPAVAATPPPGSRTRLECWRRCSASRTFRKRRIG